MNHAAKSSRRKKGASLTQRWPIVAVLAAGLLTVGHTVGGVAGLIEGWRTTVEFIRGETVPAHHAASVVAPQSHLTRLIGELRDEFINVKMQLQSAKSVSYNSLNTTFATLRHLDRNNANVPYFQAEITRIEDGVHFDPETCLRLPDQKTIDLNGVHSLFFHYLETAASAVKKFGDTDERADSCYQSELGVCRQRTAWVNHLLANDFYEIAIRTTDKDRAIGYFKRARKHAQAAEFYHPKNGPIGFAQCIDTLTLERKIDARLHTLAAVNLPGTK